MGRLSLLLCIIALLGAVACETCEPSSADGAGASASGGSVLAKIDCHPERTEPNESECQRRGCCWKPASKNETSSSSAAANDSQQEPSCFFPANFNCYNIKLAAAAEVDEQQLDDGRPRWMDNDDEDDKHLEWQHSGSTKRQSWLLERRADCPASGFHDDAQRLKLELNVYGNSIINIKISEPDRLDRHEPKLPEISLPVAVAAAAAETRQSDDANRQQQDESSSFGSLLFGEPDEPMKVNLLGDGSLRLVHLQSGKTLFETHLQKLIYSRRFVQMATRIGSSFVYGLGLHMGESLLKSRSKTYTMFNYGHPPQLDGRTAYASYPFYMNAVSSTTENGTSKLMATGGMMLNSNAMDVVVVQSSSQDLENDGGITWRLVGGIVNLFLFVGSEPHDVIGQYQSLVGKPTLPPAWALGYHQSRLNYDQLLPIKQAWARTRAVGVPVESIWTDLDFLWHSTSYASANHELNDLIHTLQNQFGMHHVSLVDPAISLAEDATRYEALKLAISMDLLAYNPPDAHQGLSLPAVVSAWVDRSALLDFTHPEIVNYLISVLREYKQQLNFDGLWLDMNEPEVFANERTANGSICPHDEELQYWPGKRNLNDRTLCMAAEFEAGKHFDLHNLYAFYQSKAHFEALKALNPAERPFLISRAQFSGQGKYGGSWLGDLDSKFEHLRWSLLGTIESNWMGQPLIGADICGFFGSTSDELCARWFSLGAFYTLARNHNHGLAKDQDPGALGEDVQRAARVALMKRYSLLPHLYSLFYQNYLEGEPVISSPGFSFFKNLLDMSDISRGEDQLVWGRSLMVAPVLEGGKESRNVHLPAGRWYDVSIGIPGTDLSESQYDSLRSNWPTPTKASASESHMGNFKRLYSLRKPIDCSMPEGCLLQDQYTPLGAVNLYLRGGSIIPTFRRVTHTSSLNSIWANPSFFLEVALDGDSSATGNIYWDSGATDPASDKYNQVHLWATSNELQLVMLKDRYSESLKFDGFVVYGAKLNGTNATPETRVHQNVRLMYQYDHGRNILTCEFKSLTANQDEYLVLKRYENITIKW